MMQRGDHQRIVMVLLPHVHDVKLKIFVEMLIMKWYETSGPSNLITSGRTFRLSRKH
jgi:hypothetical protein